MFNKRFAILITLILFLLLFTTINIGAPPVEIPVPTNPHMTVISERIVSIFFIVGIIVAISVLAYVGTRFMLAAPSEKAQLKGALIPYIVGAMILFSASTLAQIIYNIVTS